MEAILSNTEGAIATQRQQEDLALGKVVHEAESEQDKLAGPLHAISADLDGFQGKIHASEDFSEQMGTQAEDEREKLRQQVQALSKQFLGALEKTKKQRLEETQHLRNENQEIFTTLDGATQTLKQMEAQVTQVVQSSVTGVASD